MREIEFRGKSLVTREWLLGNLVCAENGHPYILSPDVCVVDGHHIRKEDDMPRYIDPATVGQYTGLKDKNGTKIYEGDILSSDLGRPIVVEYKNGAFMLRCTYNENVYHDIFFPCDEVPQSTISWTEVIGNIHDNKELLES